MTKVPHCSVGSANRWHVSFRFAETTLHQAAGMHLFKRCANRVALAILASVAVWCMGCSTFPDRDAQSRTDKLAGTPADTEKAKEARVIQMMHDIIIPELSFDRSDTLLDAIDFFKQASRDFAPSEIPVEQRGLNFVLKLPSIYSKEEDPFSEPDVNHPATLKLPAVTARFISLYDAVRLISDVVGMKSCVRHGLVMFVPWYTQTDELTTRTYYVRPSLCSERMDGSPSIKDFYESFGVEWPNGSSIQYLPVLNKLRVTNTEDNHAKMLKTLGDLNVLFQVINIEFQIVAFKAKDIERLQSRGEEISVANLNTLRRKGKAKPVATASIVTYPYQEAVIKSVKELIYPAELTAGESADTNQGNVAAVLKPDQFEMREVGVILQVIPEISDNSLIRLMLDPQWITLDGWEQYKAGISARRDLSKLSLRQPVFNCTHWHAEITVKSGETILLGGSTEPGGESVHYGFLRATAQPIAPEVEL